MPVKRCQKNNSPGYKFGDNGFCYTYKAGNKRSRERARKKAKAQGRTIKSGKYIKHKGE